MNLWTRKSIQLANQQNYLDLLFKVYPMSVNLRREIDPTTKNRIRIFLDSRNKLELIKTLLEQEVFPLKDSYIAYLKRDRDSIHRNPNTVDRIFSMLLEMGYDEIIQNATLPKETNRQIGPMFKNWVNAGHLGAQIYDNEEDFLSSTGNAILNMSDTGMEKFAKFHLGYQNNKGLDFIAKFNNKIIIAEAKFLSDFGGHQNAQFNDAITTMTSPLVKTRYNVIPISILDGVLYIKSYNKMHRSLYSFNCNQVIVSAVLLRDYLYQL